MPLDGLIMNEFYNEEHATEKPTEYTVSMRVSNLKGINKELRHSNFLFKKEEHSKKSDILLEAGLSKKSKV